MPGIGGHRGLAGVRLVEQLPGPDTGPAPAQTAPLDHQGNVAEVSVRNISMMKWHNVSLVPGINGTGGREEVKLVDLD